MEGGGGREAGWIGYFMMITILVFGPLALVWVGFTGLWVAGLAVCEGRMGKEKEKEKEKEKRRRRGRLVSGCIFTDERCIS